MLNSECLARLSRRFNGIETKINSRISGFWQSAGKAALAEKERVFEQGGAVNQPAWKPLSPSTIAARRSKGIHSVTPLQATGRLRKSIVAYTDESGRMILSTPVEYARKHQDGTGNMPRRRFLYLTDKSKSDILLLAGKFYGEALSEGDIE